MTQVMDINYRDGMENVQEKSVDGWTVTGYRKKETLDPLDTVIGNCESNKIWTWYYGRISFSSVSSFSITDYDSGTILVKATCADEPERASFLALTALTVLSSFCYFLLN